MVVAGRVLPDGDVAIMMVEAEATEKAIELVAGGATAPTEEVVAAGPRGGQAVHPGAVPRRRPSWPRWPPSRPPSSRSSWTTRTTSTPPSRRPSPTSSPQALTIAGKQEREDATRPAQGRGQGRARPASSRAARRRSSAAFRSLTKKLVRQRILRDKVRIDGRGPTDIRPLSAEVEVLPRVHGSALFERGETQILGVTTLNMLAHGAEAGHALAGEARKRYMHNYNFPPYSTGETGRVGSPKRREIGHGALAERALVPGAAGPRGVPVRDPAGLRGARLQRLDVDGLGLRLDAVAAQRRCAAEGAGRRHRDGPGLRRGRRQDRSTSR